MFQNHFFDTCTLQTNASSGIIKRFMWFFVTLCFYLPVGLAQEPPCITPTCEQMSVEIIRVYPNVATDCSNNTADCGDRFQQMFYTVYLKYNDPTPSSPTVPFNLDYKFLNVKVVLKNINDLQHSHINVGATTKCYEESTNGSLWSSYSTSNGDKVTFETDVQSVLISFQNLNSGDYCGGTSGGGAGSTQIPFEYTTPTGAGSCYGSGHACAYAELFTIVVNAWPDEYIQFSFDEDVLNYIQSDDTPCDPLDIEATGSNNGLGSTQVDLPDPFGSTENDYIQLQLSGPTAGTNEQYFTLALDNDAAHNFSINLVEFYVKVSLENYDEQLTYDGSYWPIEVLPLGADPLNSGYEAFLLHYIIDDGPWTLSSLYTLTLGTIHIANPTLSNKNYSILLSPEGGRLKTTYNSGANSACTSLDATGSGEYTVTTQHDFCASSSILFNIEKVASNDCNDPYQYKVGLYNSSPSSVTSAVRQLEFDLEFEMDAGISISSSVDFTNWGNPSGLYGLFGSPASVVQISGNVFRYAFLTTNANALNFVLNDFDNYMIISFTHSGNVCVKSIKITKLILTYANVTGCIPPINNPIEPSTQAINLSICGPKLYGYIRTETADGIKDVTIKANPPDAPSDPCYACAPDCDPAFSDVASTGDGGYGFCNLCSTCTHFLVTPEKNDNPLNGITTYDLVLISKQILGIYPLGSPYKLIAADANKSNSLTTFDIVELRKLILGIYEELPANTSWRFVDASFPFPDQDNPWSTSFPESINCVDPTDYTEINFTGIKIGDVNNSVIANRPVKRPVTTLSFGEVGNRSDGILTLPVVYTGSAPLEAIQLGIRFDPARLALIGPSKGDLPGYSAANFGLTKVDEGEIRTLWFPMTDEFENILPGQILFYLSFQVLAGNAVSAPLLYLDDNILANAAWQSDGTEYALQQLPAAAERTAMFDNIPNALQASLQPNPTSGTATLTVTTPQAMKGRIGLYKAFGGRVFVREVELVAGRQVVAIPESDNLPAGIYFWKVFGAAGQVQGHLIKL